MVPNFDAESLNMLGKLISKLERFHLESAVPARFDPSDLLEESEQPFFQIQGIADFWHHQEQISFTTHMVDVIISAHNQAQTDLTLILLGTPQKLACYLSLGSEDTTRTLLEGIFPGILLALISTETLVAQLRSHFVVQGVLTGIPSRKAFALEEHSGHRKAGPSSEPAPARQQEQMQLERVIRGMHGASWSYLIQAHPRPRSKVIEERMKTIDLLSQITSRSQTQWQSTKQEHQQSTSSESSGHTQTYSGNMINYRAQYLIRLLERELERLDQAAAMGQWLVRAYFGTHTAKDAERLASLLVGTLTGPDSRPEPLRSAICQPVGQPLEAFQTFLTSSEVALLTQLPREEVAGYAIHDYVRFDVDFPMPEAHTLPLGSIQQNGRDTGNTFNIALDALAKHAVVIGVTGSGKTTTVMNLLDRVVEAGTPFLVIEPAKTEYRSLHRVLAARTNLRIYTLGNETVAPFRLNPFEFATGEEPGSASLLTHIDFLKAVFNAAFVLYSPMPHVLESALHEVYEDKGWDLASGLNRRLPDWSKRHHYPIFPTLTDLYNKIDSVTARLGYHSEVESNVKAGLKSRIGSLRIGSKGLMLDTPRGIPMRELLSTPIVLEMEGIGSDDEKTFLMGLFLARLYEYRRVQAATGALGQEQGLQHLLVFEEAHRLLQNAAQSYSDVANPRAQAIEVFTNMLSEMRAYGQGVLVAEQIPSKLAPDVLKNTNLKIVHRLIAHDDRQSIGQTMNLSGEQQAYLGTLTPGMAAVYAEGADHAYLVRLENYKRHIVPLVDSELKRIGQAYAQVEPFLNIPDIETYDAPRTPTGELDMAAYQAAGRILTTAGNKRLWAHILLCLVANPVRAFELQRNFAGLVEAGLTRLSPEQHEAARQMIILRGGFEEMSERGALFGWSYGQVEELYLALIQGLLGFARIDSRADEEDESSSEREKRLERLETQVAAHLENFVVGYTELLQRKQGPFVGCVHCPAKCLYRAEVSTLLSSTDQSWINGELLNQSYTTDSERYKAAKQAAGYTAQKWLVQPLHSALSKDAAEIAYCAALHTMSWSGLNEYEQLLLSNGLKNYLFSVLEDQQPENI